MRRGPINVANVVFGLAVVVAVTLIVILLRNPATHANLEDPEFYDRTQVALLEGDYIYEGYGSRADLIAAGMAREAVGRLLFVRAGCVGCHGTFAEGAVVGSPLWDVDFDEFADFARDVREGPSGMPAYPEDTLSDDDLELIAEFLASAPEAAAAIGVTTTTTTTTPPIVAPPPVTTTTTGSSVTTQSPGDGTAPPTSGPPGTTPPETLALAAPIVEGIVIDGDPSEWADVPSVEVSLEPIEGQSAPSHAATVSVAHDTEYIYVLYTVDDDYDWSEIDPHYSGAPAVMWPIETAAGPHMGGDDPSGHPALGLVDIWYWRLDCPDGVQQGGAVNGPGTGDPGNDGTCNLDDEWASDPETHDDDVGEGAENSLLGAFTHSAGVLDVEGTWYFEFRRPLQTGDPLDAQFAIGGTTRLALAYWDPDAGQNGWGRRDHVQSAHLGWIEVTLAE